MDGNIYARMFDGIGFVFKTVVGMLVVFVPLGAWKAIEILIWIWQNVSIIVKDGEV